MARRDGEDWLEGRPFTMDAEAEESRQRLREPRWWLTVLVAAVLVGIAWEGAGAWLGDGDFTPREAAHNIEIGILTMVTSVFLISRMRS